MTDAKQSILIVDDNPNIRNILTKVIQGRGYNTRTAKNGHEALQTLESDGPFDLVILDVMMPVMDGFTALKEMRSRGHDKLPVIILTAKGGDEDILKGYSTGAQQYLTKPFSNRRLLKIVDRLLGRENVEEAPDASGEPELKGD